MQILPVFTFDVSIYHVPGVTSIIFFGESAGFGEGMKKYPQYLPRQRQYGSL
jgi:hypothetical protein